MKPDAQASNLRFNLFIFISFFSLTRFFESSSSPVSPMPVSKDGPVTAATEKPRAGGAGSARGAGKGKHLLGADDWIKDKKKEKENDGEKEKAKSIISKFVTDETSRSSSSPSPYTSDAK